MEQRSYEATEAKRFIMEQFVKQGDFLELFTHEELGALIDELMTLDEAYMQESGANADGVYDDDDAYDYMHAKLCEAHPAHRMYMMRLVEDYLDFNEAYLDSIGAIDWE